MSILLKKVTSTVSVLAIAASAIGATASVSAASEFLTYAENLSEAGIINAGTEASYRLGDNITRAEVAKIAVKVSGVEMYDCVGDVFSDVGTSLGDLCSAIETAAIEGFVNADAAKFRPNDLVTRAEMVKMLLAAKGVEPSDYETSFMDTDTLGDLAGYINAGVEVGALRDGSYFRPNTTATRGEAFKVASTVLALEIDEGTDNGTDNGTGTSTGTTSTGSTSTGVVTAGDLSISSDVSPIQVVPAKATVTAGKLTFAAKSSDVTIKSIIMKRGGLGNRSDIKSVWLESNGMRVTTQASVNSDETVTLSFTPSWVLKAGTTASLDLVVKLDGTSGSNHNFAIVAAKDISSTASTLAASFPVVSNTLNTMNYEVASLTYKKAGSSTLDVKGGDMNVVLGEFQLTRAGTSTNREIMVSKIKLDNEKDFDVEKNVSNLAVYDKSTGIKVSKAVTFAGGKIYVDLEDKIPGTQSSRIYQIKGDITATDRASEQLQFIFDSDEDSVIASEFTSGYRVNTAVAAGTNQDQMTLVTVKAGAVSLSTVGTTSNVDVSVGTNGVLLLNGKVNSREAVELKDLEIALDDSNGTSFVKYEKALSTITVTVGSQTVTFDAADFDNTTGVYKIRNTFNVAAGDSVVTIKADVRSDALSANSVATLGLKVKSLSSASFTGGAKYVATNKSVPSAEFYGSISPSATTVKQSTVAISNTSNGATTVVKGSRDISLAKYEYTNSKIDTVRVSGEKFSVSLGSATGGQYVPLQNMTLDLYVNGELRGSDAIDVAGTTATVDFSSVTFEIAKSSKASVEVKAREISRELANSLVLTISRTSTDNITTGANSDTLSITTPVSGTAISLGEAKITVAVATADGSDVLSSNTMKQELAVVTVTATNDDVRLTDITVPFAETADRELIQNAVLLDATKTQIASTTSVTASGIVFADLSYTIKAGTRADLYVAVDTKAISTSTSTGQTTVQLAVGSGSLLVKAQGTIDEVAASAMTLPTAGTLTAKDLISGGKLVIATKEVKNASKGQFVYSITNNGNTSVNLSSMKFGGTVAGTVKIYKNATENDDNRLDAMTIAATGSSFSAANFVRNLEIANGQTVDILVDVDLNSAISATEQTKFTLTVSDLAYAEDVNGSYTLPVTSTSAFRNTGLPKDSPAIDVNATSTLQ